MIQDEIKLDPMRLEDKSFVLRTYYNPVLAFLAFPAIQEKDIDTFLKNYINEENCLIIKVNQVTVGCILIEFNQHFRVRSIFISPAFRSKKYSRLALELLKERFPNTEFTAYIHDQQREHIQLFERIAYKASDEIQEFAFEGKTKKFIKFTT